MAADSHHHGSHHGPLHHGPLADLLDLDAVVLERYLSDVTRWVQSHATGRPTRRILDAGAGTGTGTFALTERFTDASVVAADQSPEMLERIRDKAADRGLTERVSTLLVDLGGSWSDLGSFDVVWAAAVLHEFDDADGVIDSIFSALNPGGLAAIIELDDPPRFLDEEADGGLEARIHEVLSEAQGGAYDHPDWSDHLERAGFVLVEKKAFEIDLALDPRGAGGRYAQTYFRRIQPFLTPRLSASDRVALDALIADDGPLSVRHRDDLHLRASRTAWAARRP